MPDCAGLFSRNRVPVVLQHERTECGLACLAMVAAHFGKSISLERLRQGAQLSGHGATFQELVKIADSLQLISRPVRLSLRETPNLKLPAVLHWRMNHFVLLTAVGRSDWTIHDPAIGKRTIQFAEMDESFTGVALEFTKTNDFSPGAYSSDFGILRIAGSFQNLFRFLGLMLCLLFVSQLLALVPAIATQILIDEVVMGQDRMWLFRGLAGLALIMTATLLLDALRGWISLYVGTRLTTDSTISILNHLLRLPVEFVKRRHLGDLMSKLDSLTPIREAIATHSVNAFVQFVVLVTTLVIMTLYSPWLTLVSALGLALTLGVTVALLPVSRRLGRQLLIHHRALQSSSLVETLRGYETVRSLGLSAIRRQHWQSHFLSATQVNIKQGKIAIGRGTGLGAISMGEQLMFLAVAISGILDKEITLGVVFAFMGLRSRLAGAAIALTDLIQTFSLLRVHTDRLLDIVQAAPVPESPSGAIRSNVEGDFRANGLSFSYGDNQVVIRDFSCSIKAGANAVIVGPSGCGKTTLLRILAGHLEPNDGCVAIDGFERSLWDRHSMTAQSAFVLQNDQMFQGTITENISAFSMAPDMARVRTAAIQAECWLDIQNLPLRTETLIGDSGAGLSDGQIQRLTLARALYRRPRILFLDEATSHLDVTTERKVLGNIAALNITIISVAHRPDAIALADQVIDLGSVTDSDK